jgi:hypothetical protein
VADVARQQGRGGAEQREQVLVPDHDRERLEVIGAAGRPGWREDLGSRDEVGGAVGGPASSTTAYSGSSVV